MSTEAAWIDFVAGWCSGAASIVVCQPMDTVLTRLQANTTILAQTPVATRSFVSEAGVKSLWRGSTCMIGAVPFQNALLMSGYGFGKRLAPQEYELWGVFIGGCTGGIVQSFLMSPVELIKVRQQVVGIKTLNAISNVMRGLTSSQAWRGLGATLLRDGIPHGVWFASYEICKERLSNKIGGQVRHDQMTVPLLSGAFAASVAWVRIKDCEFYRGSINMTVHPCAHISRSIVLHLVQNN